MLAIPQLDEEPEDLYMHLVEWVHAGACDIDEWLEMIEGLYVDDVKMAHKRYAWKARYNRSSLSKRRRALLSHVRELFKGDVNSSVRRMLKERLAEEYIKNQSGKSTVALEKLMSMWKTAVEVDRLQQDKSTANVSIDVTERMVDIKKKLVDNEFDDDMIDLLLDQSEEDIDNVE